MNVRRWTEEDEAKLRLLWPGDANDIGTMLDRTPAAVRARALLLGLNKPRGW